MLACCMYGGLCWLSAAGWSACRSGPLGDFTWPAHGTVMLLHHTPCPRHFDAAPQALLARTLVYLPSLALTTPQELRP